MDIGRCAVQCRDHPTRDRCAPISGSVVRGRPRSGQSYIADAYADGRMHDRGGHLLEWLEYQQRRASTYLRAEVHEKVHVVDRWCDGIDGRKELGDDRLGRWIVTIRVRSDAEAELVLASVWKSRQGRFGSIESQVQSTLCNNHHVHQVI